MLARLRFGWLLVLVLAWAPLAHAQITLSQARLRFPAEPGRPAATVELPYLWDRSHPGQSGIAEFVFDFEIGELQPEPYGLFAAKMANGYELTLNGKLIERFDTMAWPAPGDSKLPRSIPLGYALQPGHNQLRVLLRGDAGRQGGLSPLVLGTMAEVQAAHHEVWFWRVPMRMGVVIFSALVGLMGLALWLTQLRPGTNLWQRRDRIYLLMGLAEMCWVFRVADSIIESPPLPVAWWSVLSSMALGAWACLTTLFCMDLVDWGQARWARAMRRWLALLWFSGAFAAIAAWVFVRPMALTVWYGALGLTFFVFCLAFVRRSLFQQKGVASLLLTLGLVVNVVVGLTDLYLLRVKPSITGSSALYISSMLFGLAASAVVLMRFKAATTQAAHLQATLERQVRQKEQELARSYEGLAALAHSQARTAERTRILRDMHDGVGMHLSVALRQLQGGQADTGAVAGMLQEGLDQLKLSIDALNLPPSDVTALLANLRYRLEPRLQGAGVELRWLVDDIVPLPRLDDKAMRQLLFMVYGAIANVLQHSRATVLCIEAAQTEPGCRIRLIDNGRGFDASQPRSKGLQSMQERALAIGAALSIASRPGETVVAIDIPL